MCVCVCVCVAGSAKISFCGGASKEEKKRLLDQECTVASKTVPDHFLPLEQSFVCR